MDDVLNAYIYELKKGTKPMALITVSSSLREKYCEKIRKIISHAVSKISAAKIIFFSAQKSVLI